MRNNVINKTFITQLFAIILAINITVHLYPFNYPSILVTDEIARAIGSTLGIFLLALIGRFFKPSKTFGMALIAILVTPFAILVDRANDPVAPREFRELFRSSDDMEIGLPLPDGGEGDMPMTDSGAISLQYDGNVTQQDSVNTGPASTSAPAYPASENANDGPSDYQRNLDLYIKADPILSPETYETSDMPATKAANAELARQRLEASNPETASNEQPYTPYP